MNLYLALAYGIFCIVPLCLTFSLWVRRRRVERDIASFADD